MPTFAIHPLKKCPKCGEEKPLDDFAKNSSKKDGRQANCRMCKKASDARYHAQNREAQKERNAKNRETAQAFVYDYLLLHPCVDCGESDPIILEFDHLDPLVKDGHLSSMTNNTTSVRTLLKEIDKCEVRCANCHRRKTAKERNYYRYRRSNH